MEPRRKPLRLPGYDYASPNAYFVTICTFGRKPVFGDVAHGDITTNSWGNIVHRVWNELPTHYPNVDLDAFIVMPNHVHGIIILRDDPSFMGTGYGHLTGVDLKPNYVVGAGLKPAPTEKRHGLQEIIRALKTFSSRRIHESTGPSGIPVWQRGYFERVIRNERELDALRSYVTNNALKWDDDPENTTLRKGRV